MVFHRAGSLQKREDGSDSIVYFKCGSDLGGALKGFKNAVKDDETGKNEPSENAEENNGETVDVTAEKVAEKDEEEQDL